MGRPLCIKSRSSRTPVGKGQAALLLRSTARMQIWTFAPQSVSVSPPRSAGRQDSRLGPKFRLSYFVVNRVTAPAGLPVRERLRDYEMSRRNGLVGLILTTEPCRKSFGSYVDLDPRESRSRPPKFRHQPAIDISHCLSYD